MLRRQPDVLKDGPVAHAGQPAMSFIRTVLDVDEDQLATLHKTPQRRP